MSSSLDRPAPAATPLAPLRRFLDRIARWTDNHTEFRHRLPIRARIALFGAAVVALTVLIFSVLVYVIVSRSLVSQQDNNLKQQGDYVWRLLESGRPFRLGGPSFPLVDLNPQTFVNIPDAKPTDFVKATERVYFGGPDGSRIQLPIAEP